MNSIVCPRCHSRCVGKVGVDQFYCADCCIEFVVRKNQVRLYEVDPEGMLVALATDSKVSVT
jgi:transposase-like protein